MRLAYRCHYAMDIFADRLEDNQIHYGHAFFEADMRKTADWTAARKCANVNTQSRHGTIAEWYLGAPLESLPAQHAILLIPRTWLVRNGYLPWYALCLPYRFFAIRRAAELKQHLWLEWPDGDMEETETKEDLLNAA